MPIRKLMLPMMCAGLVSVCNTIADAQTPGLPYGLKPQGPRSCHDYNKPCDERHRCCRGFVCKPEPDTSNSGRCRLGRQIAH
jgi:hypothetical protein